MSRSFAENINVKSVLLGVGIGIIITATAGIIYTAGHDPMDDLTEQQIISQAEKYGMVKGSLLDNGVDTENTGIIETDSEKSGTIESDSEGSK